MYIVIKLHLFPYQYDNIFNYLSKILRYNIEHRHMKVDRKHLIIPLVLFSFVHCIDRFVLLLALNGLILGLSGLFLILDRWLELGLIDWFIVYVSLL